MKKLLLIVVFIGSVSIASSQVNDHALGVRFGFGGGISYQHGISNANRVELNLGFGLGSFYSYYRLSGIYQWVFDLDYDLNFYVGPAVSIGSLVYENLYVGNGKDGFYLLLGGQVGLDYNFEAFPLQISIDAMPMFGVINGYNDISVDPALGLRWVF